jgi:hypothetical protein
MERHLLVLVWQILVVLGGWERRRMFLTVTGVNTIVVLVVGLVLQIHLLLALLLIDDALKVDLGSLLTDDTDILSVKLTWRADWIHTLGGLVAAGGWSRGPFHQSLMREVALWVLTDLNDGNLSAPIWWLSSLSLQESLLVQVNVLCNTGVSLVLAQLLNHVHSLIWMNLENLELRLHRKQNRYFSQVLATLPV